MLVLGPCGLSCAILILALGPLCAPFPLVVLRPMVDVRRASEAAVGCVNLVAPPPRGLNADLVGAALGEALGEESEADPVEPVSPCRGDAAIVARPPRLPKRLETDMDSLPGFRMPMPEMDGRNLCRSFRIGPVLELRRSDIDTEEGMPLPIFASETRLDTAPPACLPSDDCVGRDRVAKTEDPEEGRPETETSPGEPARANDAFTPGTVVRSFNGTRAAAPRPPERDPPDSGEDVVSRSSSATSVLLKRDAGGRTLVLAAPPMLSRLGPAPAPGTGGERIAAPPRGIIDSRFFAPGISIIGRAAGPCDLSGLMVMVVRGGGGASDLRAGAASAPVRCVEPVASATSTQSPSSEPEKLVLMASRESSLDVRYRCSSSSAKRIPRLAMGSTALRAGEPSAAFEAALKRAPRRLGDRRTGEAILLFVAPPAVAASSRLPDGVSRTLGRVEPEEEATSGERGRLRGAFRL